jgi:hypothetical protein
VTVKLSARQSHRPWPIGGLRFLIELKLRLANLVDDGRKIATGNGGKSQYDCNFDKTVNLVLRLIGWLDWLSLIILLTTHGLHDLPVRLDRFMFMLWLDYPSFEEEVNILKSTTTGKVTEVNPIFSKEEILTMQDLIRKLPVADNVYEYAVKLVEKTRVSTPKAHPIAQKYLSWGAGPRASQNLILGAKCYAALKGKYSPDIEDVKAVAVSVLRHRIVQNYSAQAEGYTTEKIIIDLINS